jgi:hypothetical protein
MEAKQEMKKIVVPGLAAGVLILIASLVLMQAFEAIVPGIAAEYQTPLFRPWTDPLMMLFFLYPFILGIAFAWLWFKTKKVWKTPYEMAFAYFCVASIPGMFVTLTSMTISYAMIATWTLGGLIYLLCAAFVIEKMKA